MANDNIDLKLAFDNSDLQSAGMDTSAILKKMKADLEETQRSMNGAFSGGVQDLQKFDSELGKASGKIVKQSNQISTASKNYQTFGKTVKDSTASIKELDKTKDSLNSRLTQLQGQYKKVSNTITEQKKITLEFKQELVRLEQQYQQTPKTAFAAQKPLLDQINNLKAAIKDQGVAQKQLALDKNIIAKNIKSVEGAISSIEDYKGSLRGSAEDLGIFNTAIGRTINDLGRKVAGMSKLITVVGGATKGFKALRVALISTGIGAIVVALGSLIAFLTRTQKGVDFLSRVTAVLSTGLAKLGDFAADIGERLFNAFSNPKQALQSLTDFLVGQVVNRFNGLINLIKSLGAAVSALASRDMEGLKQAGKDAALAIGAINTGFSEDQIVNGIDKIKKGAKELNEVAKEAGELQDRKNKLRDKETAFIAEAARLEKELVENREKMADDSLSLNERQAAYNKALSLSDQIEGKRLSLLKEKLSILESEKGLTNSLDADLREIAEVEAEIQRTMQRTAQSRKQLLSDNRRIARESDKASSDQIAAQKELNKLIAEANKNLQSTFQGLDDTIKQGQIGQLEGIEKINAEYEYGQQLLRRQIDEIKNQIDEAEKAGVSAEEISKRRQALIKFEVEATKIAEAEKSKAIEAENEKRRQNELRAFLDLEGAKTQLELERIAASGESQGANTSDEVANQKRLEAELKALDKQYTAIIESVKGNEEELQKVELEYEAARLRKKSEIDNVTLSNRLKAIDRITEINLLEVENLKRDNSSLLTLEEQKEQARLNIILNAQQERLKEIDKFSGENSPEAVLLRKQIQALQNEIDNINLGGGSDPFGALKESLADALGFTDQQFQALGDSLASSFNFYLNHVNALANEANARLDEIRANREEIQSELNEELELQEKGLANNVKAKQEELANVEQLEKEAQAEAEKRQKAATRAQLIQEGAQQVSAIVTSVANIIKGFSSIPIVGTVLGIAAGAAMLGSWISLKARAKDTVQLYDGGALGDHMSDGATRSSGLVKRGGLSDRHGRGHRIEGTNIEVGGSEYIVNDRVTASNMDFLNSLNAGRYSRLNLKALAENAKFGLEVTGSIADRQNELTVIKETEYRERTTEMDKAMTQRMDALLKKNFDRLIYYHEALEEKIYPMVDGKFFKKRGNRKTITNKP